jgi:23S rRNA pseudouridine1911/1915/1917 synthase
MASRSDSITVEQSLPFERLDVFLKSQLPQVSRGVLQSMIEDGAIVVSGKKVKPTYSPRAGDVIDIHWPEPISPRAEPEKMPLDVLFEDDQVIVLNKPPGLVVHPAAGHHGGTLVNALLHHCKGQLSGIAGVARPGIVHRLDMDTSGCIVVAKTNEAHLNLAAQFEERRITKIYRGIVCGELANERGEIQVGIARHPTHRKRMAASESGSAREAWTTFQIVERLHAATHVECRLHTGRTHQIRVHFQYIGHPLVGDTVYGAKQNARLKTLTNYAAGRQMLHAWKLGFVHPTTQKPLNFEAPFPEDFQKALRALKPSGEKPRPEQSRGVKRA